MVYRVIGLMSGSSLDGLDIAFVEFQETGGKWAHELKASSCYAYDEEWVQRLKMAHTLSAIDYCLLHAEYGHYIGREVQRFIREHGLEYKVQLIASHGHTTFHLPDQGATGQIGDGAAIAAETGINVVSDLRALDVALGGQGAPIVPIGEKMLLGDYDFFLNIGGIANLSYNDSRHFIAFDVCPGNRVLNMLAQQEGLPYDDRGALSRQGSMNEGTLKMLNELEYYHGKYPKSLSNSFGTDVVFPLIAGTGKTRDVLRTYVEHIALQVKGALEMVMADFSLKPTPRKMMITGGGGFNDFLVQRISEHVTELGVEVAAPPKDMIEFKEAVIMAFIGLLRWREENNVLASVTGARRDSIGGAVWLGQEA